MPGVTVIEVWHHGKFLVTIAGADGPGVRVITKHGVNAKPGPDDGSGVKAFVRFSALAPEGNVIDKEWEDRSEQIYTTISRWLRLPK